MIGYTLGLYRGYIGIVEHEMETTAVIGLIWGVILGHDGCYQPGILNPKP